MTHAPLAATVLAAAVLAASLAVPTPAQAQDTHLLVVVGIGGDPAHTERFLEWGTALRNTAIEQYGLPADRALLLAEDPSMDPAIHDESRRENVEAELAGLAERVGAQDRVLLVLIGHGSFRGEEANFNLPGPDLSASELKGLLDALPTSRVAVVNTASASGPYTSILAAPGRTIITATASGGERNETQFGGHFVAAWQDAEADLDKNGTVSLLEAFQYARRETARFYDEQNRLPTEHALLEDDGDGEGTREPGPDTGDGALAAGFTLGTPGMRAIASDAPAPTSADSVLTRLYAERAALEGRVADLRRRSDTMDPDEYDRALEAVLVELALKNREIRAREGGR